MGSTRIKNEPNDKRLYSRVVAEAKQKFMVWPSAYASGWVVKTYKNRGGTYATVIPDRKPKDLDRRNSNLDERPLRRWYDEEWVDVCTYAQSRRIVPCGRSKAQLADYPYCRPLRRVSSKTPTTLHEAIRKEGIDNVLERCRKKKHDPLSRMKKI